MRTVLIPTVLLALLLAACGGDDAGAGLGAADGRVSVVASFYPLAEVAQRVGGDRVEVVNLTPGGAEPHDLELSPRDVERLEDADLVVVLGRDFQPAVERVAEGRREPTLVALDALDVGEGRVAEDDHGHDADDADDADDDGHGHEDDGHDDDVEDGHDDDVEDGHDDSDGLDPHVWLDPTLMASLTEEITTALADIDPDGASSYRANADDYVAELEALDERYQSGLAECERDVIVVAHNAFGWLTRRYDLRQEAIAGLSPDQEPSPRRLDQLVDLVEDEGITTIFTEVLVSPRVAETLAREAGVETAVLDPIEGIPDDRLAAGETYLSVMDDNLAALRAALGCR
jgi:zinc transport system substrate-binding protein